MPPGLFTEVWWGLGVFAVAGALIVWGIVRNQGWRERR